jgi:hypothetical protein
MEMCCSVCAKTGDIRDTLRARGKDNAVLYCTPQLGYRTTAAQNVAPPATTVLCCTAKTPSKEGSSVDHGHVFAPQDSLTYSVESDVMMTVRKGRRGLFKGLVFEWLAYRSDLGS